MANYRNNFLRTHKYERKIIVVPLLSTLFLCTILTIIILALQHDFLKLILYSNNSETISLINKWAILFIVYLWVYFFIVVMITFTISNNLVGAFIRVINELDKIIIGKKKTHIFVRKEDDLGSELIKRINILIDKANGREVQIFDTNKKTS